MSLDPKVYYEIFEMNPNGKQLLEEMCRIFYDRQSYVQGDFGETAFNEGKKSVLQFIINKINKSQEKGDTPNDDSLE